MTTTSAENGSLGTAPAAGVNSPSGAQIVGNIGPASGNVAIATKSGSETAPKVSKPATADQLREAAIAEAERVETVSDEAGWTLMELMLQVRESFVNPATGKLNEKAFEAFLVKHGAKPHGNVKNPAQRLAKVCCPKSSDRVSKYGYALSALIKRNIGSAAVKVELSKRETLTEDGVTKYFGVNRFVLLHKQVDTTSAVPKKKTGTASPNRYMDFDPDRLKKEALLILRALKTKEILPSKFEGLMGVLDGSAETA